MVSRVNIVREILFMNLWLNMYTTNANAVIARYCQWVIQNGLTPRKISRMVPPPQAVAIPTINAPNKSKFFSLAKRMPLIAKAKVPMKSSNVINVNDIRVKKLYCTDN